MFGSGNSTPLAAVFLFKVFFFLSPFASTFRNSSDEKSAIITTTTTLSLEHKYTSITSTLLEGIYEYLRILLYEVDVGAGNATQRYRR